MKILFLLLSFLAGILCHFNLYFLLLFIPLIIFIFVKEKYKFGFICLVISVLGCIYPFISFKGFENDDSVVGLVTRRSENYVLVITYKGSYYVSCTQNSLNLLDIVKVTGTTTNLEFSRFEMGFDFTDYLNSKGVFKEIEGNIETIFTNPIKLEIIKNFVLKFFNDNSKDIATQILFSTNTFETNDFSDFITLMSLNSLSIYYLLNFIDKWIDKFNGPIWLRKLVSYSILSFLFFIHQFKYSIFRLLAVRTVKELKFVRLSSLEINSLLLFGTLIINPYFIFSKTALFTFPIILFFNISYPVLNKFKGIKGFLVKNVLLILFMIPIMALSEYKINLIKILITPILFLIFQRLYLLMFITYIISPIGFLLSYFLIGYKGLISGLAFIDIKIVFGRGNEVLFAVFYLIFIALLIAIAMRFVKTVKILSFVTPIILIFGALPNITNHYEVHFINVGQGDCALVRYKKENFLIDTGGSMYNDLATECLIPYLESLKIFKLDYVFISHRDFDHYGALESLTENYEVEKVLYSEVFSSVKVDDLVIQNLNHVNSYTETNDKSSVLKFTIKETSFLFTGDISKTVEEDLIKQQSNLIDCDVLKVAHHGSNSSSSIEFLKECSPELAVISCGLNNIYRHPSDEVISNLENLNIEYKRTDLDGTVVYRC